MSKFIHRVQTRATAVGALMSARASLVWVCNSLFVAMAYANTTNSVTSFTQASAAVAMPQADLTVEQLLQQVRLYQAEHLGWQTQQQMADAQLKQHALWANPSLSVEQTGFQSQQDQELAIGISQPLDIFGQRQAAMNVAKLAQQQVELNQQQYQAELALIVQYAWSQVALLQLEKSSIAEQLQVSQQNLAATRKRYQAGSIAQVDLDRVEMAHLQDQRGFAQADLQLQLAQKQLARLWGADALTVQIAPSAAQLWSRAAAVQAADQPTDQLTVQPHENWFERNLQLQMQRQQAEIDQLRAQSRPQPTVTLGVNRTRSVDQNTENQIRLGVEIPLNLFKPQKYAMQIAAAKQTLIQQQQRFYQQQNQFDIALALTELRGLEQQFNQLNEQQLPLALEVQQKTLAGFGLGKFDLTAVQQATTQLQALRLLKVQLLKQAWQLSIGVQSARMGLAVEQITAKDALMQLNQRVWQQSHAFANP